MEQTHLEKRIIERAEAKAQNEYKKMVDFMMTNELFKRIQFRKGETLVPFCDNYGKKPLFETGINNKMEDTDKYTNFNEARKQVREFFIKQETDELLNKIDSLTEYFNNSQT